MDLNKMELGDLTEPKPAPTQQQIADSLWNRVVGEIRRLEDEHRLVVIITHGCVDMMINALIEKRCRHQKQIVEDHRQWTHATRLVLLNEMRVLDDEHYRLLKWFNALRNDFAHKPLFELKPDRMTILFRPEHRDLKKFADLCVELLMEIWLSYFPLIGDLFIEGITASDDPAWPKTMAKQGMIPLMPTK